MSTPQATPTRVDLRPSARPVPLAQPLRKVRYFYHDKNTGLPMIVRSNVVTSVTTHCLEEAFKLARSIILHPTQLPGVASLLTAPQPAPPQVAAAIRHVFATKQLRLWVDTGCDDTLFGHHERPTAGDDAEDTERKRITIGVGRYFTEQLTRAYGDWGNPDDYRRVLLLFAVGVAHELVHALRGLVQPLLRTYGIVVPDDTPSKPCTKHGSIDGEAGWEFEEALVGGGRLEAAWIVNGSDTPSPSPPSSPLSAVSLRGILGDSLVPLVDGPPTPLALPREPFDLLVIGFTDGRVTKYYEVDDAWIEEAVASFRSGTLDEFGLVPRTFPEKVEPHHIRVVGQRHRRGGPPPLRTAHSISCRREPLYFTRRSHRA